MISLIKQFKSSFTDTKSLISQNKNFYKKFFNYSLPVLITTILSSILDMVEAILLSRADPIFIATLNVTSPFFMMISLIFAAFPTAATAIISQYYGEENFTKAKKTGGLFIIISNLFLATITLIIFLNLSKIISLLVNKKELRYLATEYLRIKFIGIIFFCNTNLISTIFKSFLEFYKPFYIIVTAIILNFILDIIFIFGLLGFPKLGIVGAAYGYTISFFLASIVLYLVLLTDKIRKPIFSEISIFLKETFKKITDILLPAISEPIFIQSGYIVFHSFINRLELAQISAHRIAIYIEAITFIPGYTLSQVMQPISGYYYGKKDEEGLKKTVKLVEILVFSLMGSIGLTFLIFPQFYSNIFTKSQNVKDFSITCIQLAFFEQPFLAITFIYLNFMRGLGLNRLTLFVSIIGVWGIRIPLTYVCIFILKMDIRYIWVLTIFDWAVRAFLFVLIYNSKGFFTKLLKNT